LRPKPTARGRRSAIELEKTAELPGVPLAVAPNGGLIEARPDRGKNRWDAHLLVGSPGKESAVDVMEPVLELKSGPGGVAAVLSGYRIAMLGPELRPDSVIGTGGIGISVVDGPGRAVVVTSSAPLGRDALRVLTGARKGESRLALTGTLQGSIVASAWARLEHETELVFALRPPGGGTDVFRLAPRDPIR
jgi:hypothetical protein